MEFKNIADNLVKNIKEEWSQITSKWAPAEEEATRRFEEQKEKFRTTLNTLDVELNKWNNSGREELESIKQKIDELHVQLTLGKAEGIEAFEAQKKNITEKWTQLKQALEKFTEYNRMQTALKQELLDWRIKMDMLKIQFSLGKMEVKDSWKNISQEISREAEHLGKVVEAGAGIAGEKLDHFEEEIKKLINKIRK